VRCSLLPSYLADLRHVDLFRVCFLRGIQNVKYNLLWNDEMQNAKIFRIIFSFI
jgi:hypothetical protein